MNALVKMAERRPCSWYGVVWCGMVWYGVGGLRVWGPAWQELQRQAPTAWPLLPVCINDQCYLKGNT